MKLLEKWLFERNIHLNAEQINQFDTYYRVLIEWNQKMNLTAITDEREVALKHFYDSLTPSFYFSIQAPLKMCDVGSGAGFPGIPLKILYPEIELTIVDSLKKRITFLETLVSALKLNHVCLFHDRAESFARKPENRETYDLVTARAVAKLSVLSEYCLPLVRQGGTFIALKGSQADQELEQANSAIVKLGGRPNRSVPFLLPDGESSRTLIFIDKKAQTPKRFPRKPGMPAKNPL